ncbi:hypothetical protein BGZ58_005075 [Dissophora ornata]|nr:hypothetical protein BGZ58_005075 [Dissophora ornata]
MAGPSLLKPNRSHVDVRGRSLSPPGRKRAKPSVISDSSLVEEDEMAEEYYEYAERKDSHQPEHILEGETEKREWEREKPNRITIKTPAPDTHIDYSTHHPKAQEHTQSFTSSVSSLRRNSNTPSLLGKSQQLGPTWPVGRRNSNTPSLLSKKLSIDNIRQISRNALTRIQEGGIGAALNIPATAGPLSPTTMRTAYGGGVADPSLAAKSQSHAGHVALEHELSECTRPQLRQHEPDTDRTEHAADE